MLPSELTQTPKAFDIDKYIRHLKHWAWLIILATVVAGASAYIVSGFITPLYRAKTILLINEVPANKTIDYNSIVLSSSLSQTYAQMMVKSPILDEVARRVGLPQIDPERISAVAEANLQLITITAESTNPIIAANIANTLVDVFREQVLTLQSSRFADYKTSLSAQIADMEKQMEDVNQKLSKATTQADKELLNTQLTSYQDAYDTLLQSYESVKLTEAQVSSSIVQIEPAVPPAKAAQPKTLQNVALAGIAGMFLAAVAIYLMEMLDDSLKAPDEFARALNLPILGMISHYSSSGGAPILETHPGSVISDSFRSLRTNMNVFASHPNQPVRTILVASPMGGEGKSIVTVNLGIAFAQNGQRTTIIDANLRRPRMQDLLRVDNNNGLSQALSLTSPEFQLNAYIQPTRFENLSVIPAGRLTTNSSELLGSHKMKNILNRVKASSDIVLIDTPPALSVADASILIPFVDGVLIVMKPGSTHRVSARQIVEQFQRVGANILGVVLNNINLRRLKDEYLYYGRDEYGLSKLKLKRNSQPSQKKEDENLQAESTASRRAG